MIREDPPHFCVCISKILLAPPRQEGTQAQFCPEALKSPRPAPNPNNPSTLRVAFLLNLLFLQNLQTKICTCSFFGFN
jgi:hypothetical protein